MVGEPWQRRIVVLVVCVHLVRTADNYDGVENWPWARPRLLRVGVGRRAELRCAGRVHGAPAHWDYKPCGGGENETSCLEVIQPERAGGGGAGAGWRRLAHTRSPLVLVAVSARDAGLYRCREAATPRLDVYSALELEVLQHETDEDTRRPQFLDGLPENVTVQEGEQAIFQCKVWSRSVPSIVWLVEAGKGEVRWGGRRYATLGAQARQRTAALPGDMYASSLAVEARAPAARRYYCVAVNTRGFVVRGADLVLLPAAAAAPHSYYWLFLMPLALAAIPLLLWTVFLCSRRGKVAGEVPAAAAGSDLGSLQIELVHLNRPQNIPEDDIV